MSQKYKCPNCGSSEFITEPNQYDVLEFSKYGFKLFQQKPLMNTKYFVENVEKS
mgnify:CR=1 FL=1|jgi:rRNA maturation protein Nop10